MKLSSNLKALIAILLIFVAIFSIEPLYTDALYDQTLADVPRMQMKKRLYGFFEIFTQLGETTVPIMVMTVLFNVTHKMKALYVWIIFGFACYLNASILKSIYAEPRPFWVSPNIKPMKCRKDFGNPSGHAMTVSMFWITVYLQKYHEVGVR